RNRFDCPYFILLYCYEIRYINENLPQGRFFASRKAIDRNCWTLKKMKFCSKELFKLKRAIISSNLFQKKNG
ncbi:hypothetical protein J5E98_09990, partial [Streptococcus pneumoniae]|nr:hypothetical protein [Streptococcus pneumoniae]